MTPRRELQVAVGLCLLGSLLVLWASSRTWVSLPTPDRLTQAEVRTGLSGRRVSGLPSALGLVSLAGVLALAATRGWGRAVVGAVVAACGALVVVDAARTLRSGVFARAAEARAGDVCGTGSTRDCIGAVVELVGVQQRPGWAWLTVVGGVVLVVAGTLVAVRGRRWAGLGSSYEVPAARPARPAGDKDVWDALDRGDDPTA